MSEVNNTTFVDFDAKVKAIDACLPQTQCTRCSFPDCISYAKAIANNEADINQCPPGGDVTIAKLATLLEVEVKPLNEVVHGEHKPRFEAKIIEDLCIGCTMCIKACPVDAIIGGHKSMHVIIADECTGCELCIPPCPMDCITMELPENIAAKTSDSENTSPWKDFGYTDTQTQYAKQRHHERETRLDKTSISKSQQINARKLSEQDIDDTIMDILKRKL